MAKREKSINELTNQWLRIRNSNASESRKAKATETFRRYAGNIIRTEESKKDVARFQDSQRAYDAIRNEFSIGKSNSLMRVMQAAYDQKNEDYDRSNNRKYSRDVYMGQQSNFATSRDRNASQAAKGNSTP